LKLFSAFVFVLGTLACASSQGTASSGGGHQDPLNFDFSSRQIKDGTVAFVKVRVPPSNPNFGGPVPVGKFKDQEIPFFEMQKGSPVQGLDWIYGGILPVPYQMEPQSAGLEIRFGDDGTTFYEPFSIISGKYPSEVLKVDGKRVKLNPKDLKRAIAEAKEVKAIYKVFTPQRFWEGAFVLPVRSKITSIYGSRRVYNGVMKSFHKGTDLRAPVGTPIRSTAGGRVVLSKDLFYTGNTILVDHGYGIYTLYAHMSKLLTKKGQRVKRGQKLGLAGKTGRVNGPHLHWGAVIYGHKVDPISLTREIK